jgi:hypothetical protein
VRSDEEPMTKKKGKLLICYEKVEMLDMLNRGVTTAVVGRHYGISKSTICFIMKNEDISRSVKASVMVICAVFKDSTSISLLPS